MCSTVASHTPEPLLNPLSPVPLPMRAFVTAVVPLYKYEPVPVLAECFLGAAAVVSQEEHDSLSQTP